MGSHFGTLTPILGPLTCLDHLWSFLTKKVKMTKKPQGHHFSPFWCLLVVKPRSAACLRYQVVTCANYTRCNSSLLWTISRNEHLVILSRKCKIAQKCPYTNQNLDKIYQKLTTLHFQPNFYAILIGIWSCQNWPEKKALPARKNFRLIFMPKKRPKI